MMQRHRVELLEKDDLNLTGFEIVHEHVRRAASDVELCFTLGKLLDMRRDALLALMKAVRELSIEKARIKH